MNRLFVNKLMSIGAVEDPDNEPAQIMLFKRKEQNPVEGRNERRDMAVDLSHLDETAQAAVQKEIDALEAKIAELEAGGTVEEPPPDYQPETVVKRLTAQDEQIAKANARAEQAEAEASRVRDEQLTERYTERAETLKPILGDDMAPVLKELAVKAPEAFAKLDAQLGSLVGVEKFNDLLREYGDGAATGSARDQIDAYAAEIKKANPDLNLAEAKAQAWTDHPELVRQSREEGV